jgi:hypothetical protein
MSKKNEDILNFAQISKNMTEAERQALLDAASDELVETNESIERTATLKAEELKSTIGMESRKSGTIEDMLERANSSNQTNDLYKRVLGNKMPKASYS